MKHKVIALTAALSMLGGSIAALPAMAAEQMLFADDFNSYTVGEYGEHEGNMSWYYWDNGAYKQKVISSYDEEENNHYITLKDRSKAYIGLNTGNITFEKGVTYSISFDAKSETSQTFSLDPTGNMTYTLNNPTISSEDGWKTITGTLSLNDDYEQDTLTVGIWFQTAAGSWTNGDFSLDNVKITYDDGTPATDPVAKVGDTEYTSLDDAIDNANYETITLLGNATLEKAREWNTATTIDGAGHTITVATPNGTDGSAIFDTLTLSNATLTGSTNQNIANNAYLTNVTVDDLTYDCLALNNFTAAGCNLEHNNGVYLFAGNVVDGKLSMTNTTITVIQLGWTNLLFRVPANDTPTFSNVTIKGLTATGTKIAEVNETEGPGSGSVSKEGITVEGLADTQELKVVDGKQLVIADKPAPASYTAEVGDAEVQHGTGDYANTVATGFRATVTNNGGTEGTFNTVKWDVTFDGKTKTTGDQTITNVTLDPNAKATISLVVDNLNGEGATATVEIIR